MPIIDLLEDDELADLLGPKRERPMVIMAISPGCGACFQVSQALSLMAEHTPQVDFCRLEVQRPALVAACLRLGIQVAPTVIVWHRGQERARLAGQSDTTALWELRAIALQGEAALLP